MNEIKTIKQAEEFIIKYENGCLEKVKIKYKLTFPCDEEPFCFSSDKELIAWCNEQRLNYFSNDNNTPCEKCLKIKPDVRFEGSEEGFYCDECLYELKGGLKK